MEDLRIKVLGVKEWFSDKNGMVNYRVDTVLEVREKACRITMTSKGRTFFYWVPKSCLEIREDCSCDPSKYENLDGKTLDEVIEMYKCIVSVEELIKMNREEYNYYC